MWRSRRLDVAMHGSFDDYLGGVRLRRTVGWEPRAFGRTEDQSVPPFADECQPEGIVEFPVPHVEIEFPCEHLRHRHLVLHNHSEFRESNDSSAPKSLFG